MVVFQTARELFQQQMESDDKNWKKTRSTTGQMYHVNADGKFSDSGDEEEESLAQQIKHQAMIMSGITPATSDRPTGRTKKPTRSQESISLYYGNESKSESKNVKQNKVRTESRLAEKKVSPEKSKSLLSE